jgi:enamine deaminase RidA (YjgF/YER057c/UK114 family)
MKKSQYLSLFILTISFSSCMQVNQPESKDITRYDRPEAPILWGVDVPAGTNLYFTSGLVAPMKNPDASPESYERYGNTYEQSIGTLKRIEEKLAEAGYSMKDVFYLRVYLAPDADGVIHWQSWFDAYGEYFNNAENPNKVARTTLGVHSLARPDILVEIEAVAGR